MSQPPFLDVRQHGFGPRASVESVWALLDERLTALPAEVVPIAQAAGRVLAHSVSAAVAVPGFDRAAMDGYAVHAGESHTYPIVGLALPGQPHPHPLPPGSAIEITTGAPVPLGATAVVPWEQVALRHAGHIALDQAPTPGKHISRIGEDVPYGAEVLHATRRLRPQDVGLLASVGVAQVSVVRRPSVSIIATGGELVPAGEVPTGYQIADSNTPMLCALIERDGGNVVSTQIVPDRVDLLRAALTAPAADVLIVSGGSSVGREDHAPSLVAELGELAVHGLALRPAGPTGVGFVGGRVVFLLPGNPVACLCGYDLFAGRAIRALGGRTTALPYRAVSATLGASVASVVGRVDYVRVRVRNDIATPTAVSGASRLSTATLADGFLLLAAQRETLTAGETVTVYLYD